MTPNREYIIRLVREREWSDSEFARQMGVSRAEANRFMNGKRVGGKKLMSGLLRAFPNETTDTLFIIPQMSLIVNNNCEIVTKEKRASCYLPVKNLNNAKVAMLDSASGVIEVREHGYITQFRVPPGTVIEVVHTAPP
jgi:transcriptional regulator with XRE-family HTH domain